MLQGLSIKHSLPLIPCDMSFVILPQSADKVQSDSGLDASDESQMTTLGNNELLSGLAKAKPWPARVTFPLVMHSSLCTFARNHSNYGLVED